MKEKTMVAFARMLADAVRGKEIQAPADDEPAFKFAAGEAAEIEIARPGIFTDMHKREVPLTETDLIGMAGRFDPLERHLLKLGHVDIGTDTPVHGEVKGLRYDENAKRLKATVVPTELGVEANKKGGFKFCSLEADPTDAGLSLTNIGMLAAWKPAIDGLAPFSFGEAVKEKKSLELAQEIEADEQDMLMFGDYNQADRDKMAKSGEAMSDGSFPIKDSKDLNSAVHLWGHSKNPDAAKAHIKKRAKALGMESKLPDNWSSGEKDKVAAAVPRDKQEGFMAEDSVALAKIEERTKRAEQRLAQLAQEEVSRFIEANAERLGKNAMPIATVLFGKLAEIENSDKAVTVKFGEAGKEKEVSLYEMTKSFVAALPSIIGKNGVEFAKTDDAVEPAGTENLPKLANGMVANPEGDTMLLAAHEEQENYKKSTGKVLSFAAAADRAIRKAAAK